MLLLMSIRYICTDQNSKNKLFKMKSKDTLFSKKRSINCNGKLLDLSTPKVMGILNITPDSFYDGGSHNNPEAAIEHVEKMLNEGAAIIDVGAFSSRPGAKFISEEEELKRLSQVLGPIRKKYPDIIISVDTFRSKIAKKMLSDFRVDIINDISAGSLDKDMLRTIGDLKTPYIMMHMQGTPLNMQTEPAYANVVNDIINFFIEAVRQAGECGINDIIIDPGFGFGKTTEHNYTILKNLTQFGILEIPLLAGISRKSMIYKPLDTTPEFSLHGTIALNMIALMGGADILRVHDVKEANEVIKLFLQFENS
jgi:dihydropteroate synthase